MTEVSIKLRELMLEAFQTEDPNFLSENFDVGANPEWDSFTHLTLLIAVQEHFKFSILPNEIEQTLNLAEFEKLIESKTKALTEDSLPLENKTIFNNFFNECQIKNPIRDDDVIYIHSNSKGLLSISGNALNSCLDILSKYNRTLVFPTFPFTEKTYTNYLQEHPTFHVETTESRTGLLPEMIRLRDDAFRSAHPLLSECAIGDKSEWLLKDAHLDPNPFHYNSSYIKLLECDAAMLGLGVDIGTNALIHLVDHKLEEKLGFHIFQEAKIPFNIRFPDGHAETLSFIAYDPKMIKRIKPRELRAHLPEDSNFYFETTLNNVPFYWLRLRPFIEFCVDIGTEALDRGDLPPWYPK